MEDLVSFKEIWSSFQGKKVFITGHTGFKGAWLSAILQMAGAELKGYSLEPEYKDGLYDVLKPESLLREVIADIRDVERLNKEIQNFNPDFIFHLAAQPLVRRSYKAPAETFDVNVTGTANLLECAGRLKEKCSVVVVTTDKVYENKEQNILYSEEDILGGYDPYSASKACTEMVVSSFRNSFFHPQQFSSHLKSVATARAGNVIGGGDWSEDRIIPDIIRSLSSEKSIEVRNPDSVRPWQHVLEPLKGYLMLAYYLDKNNQVFSGAYNFGPSADDHVPVGELVELAISQWGKGEWKRQVSTGQPHEAGLLKLSIVKAENELGWKPKLNSSEAIRWTIDWYKKNRSEQALFTKQQIKDYFAL